MTQRWNRTAVFIALLTASTLGCKGDRFGTAQPHVAAGVQALNQGKPKKAVENLLKALNTGVPRKEKALVLTTLGNAWSGMGQLEEAVAAHEKALHLNPKLFKAWVNLGIVYRRKKAYGKARDCYAKASALKPDYPEVHNSLGVLYIFQGKSLKAVESLERATRLDPTMTVAHANLALAYAMDRRPKHARKALRKAEKLGYTRVRRLRARLKQAGRKRK